MNAVQRFECWRNCLTGYIAYLWFGKNGNFLYLVYLDCRQYQFLSAGQEHIVTLVTTLPVLVLCAAVLRSSQLVKTAGSSSSELTRRE